MKLNCVTTLLFSKVKKYFTLIELLVVIAIITIRTSSIL